MQDPYNHTGSPYGGGNPYGNGGNPDPYANNNPYTNGSPGHIPARHGGDRLATAAMLMGILSVVMFFVLMFHLTLIFGSIGIVLALLSKGRLPRMVSRAKTGIIASAISVLFTFLLCGTAFTMLYTNPDLMDQVNDMFEQQYGMSYEEMMDIIINGEEVPYE